MSFFKEGSFITKLISTLLATERLKISRSSILFTIGLTRSDFVPQKECLSSSLQACSGIYRHANLHVAYAG